MKKLIILMLALCMTTFSAFAGTFKADARTKRIPAGTVFQLEFLQPVSTFSGSEGDSFVATLKNELSTVGKDGKQEYVNSFGVGGISIGSHRVVSLSLPQIAYIAKYSEKDTLSSFFSILESRIKISPLS